MILNFPTMPETVLPQFLSGEKELCARMFSDDANRILLGRLAPGASIGMHRHETSSEIIYILSGSGKVLLEQGEEAVTAGVCHYCPKGSLHSLVNSGAEELVFFAVVPQQ